MKNRKEEGGGGEGEIHIITSYTGPRDEKQLECNAVIAEGGVPR